MNQRSLPYMSTIPSISVTTGQNVIISTAPPVIVGISSGRYTQTLTSLPAQNADHVLLSTWTVIVRDGSGKERFRHWLWNGTTLRHVPPPCWHHGKHQNGQPAQMLLAFTLLEMNQHYQRKNSRFGPSQLKSPTWARVPWLWRDRLLFCINLQNMSSRNADLPQELRLAASSTTSQNITNWTDSRRRQWSESSSNFMPNRDSIVSLIR